jgi:hypothetical protein
VPTGLWRGSTTDLAALSPATKILFLARGLRRVEARRLVAAEEDQIVWDFKSSESGPQDLEAPTRAWRAGRTTRLEHRSSDQEYFFPPCQPLTAPRISNSASDHETGVLVEDKYVFKTLGWQTKIELSTSPLPMKVQRQPTSNCMGEFGRRL